jgi:hypothetical protein
MIISLQQQQQQQQRAHGVRQRNAVCQHQVITLKTSATKRMTRATERVHLMVLSRHNQLVGISIRTLDGVTTITQWFVSWAVLY